MTSDLMQITTLFLALISASILILKEWNLIRNTYRRFRTLFRVHIIWSKKDRIKALSIREKYQLPKDIWIKDESQIKVLGKPVRRKL